MLRTVSLQRIAGSLLAVTLAACGGSDSRPELRDGIVVAGDARAFSELLESLEAFGDAPIAASARKARQALAPCSRFRATCADPADCALPERIECVDGGDEASADGAWRFSYSDPDGHWLEASGRPHGVGGASARSGVEVTAELGGPTEGPISLLLPSAESPGPARLASAGALLQARVRPAAGLDLASLVSGEGLAHTLFKLKSDLFAATTLAGNWELAVYLPEEGQRLPPMALALDFTDRERAVGAMESFIDEVRADWPVRRTPMSLGGREGACLGNLNLMPDLAPCYVAGETAIIIGWNPASLDKALAPPAASEGVAETSWATAHLDRFALADERIARISGVEPPPPIDYPWSRATVEGSEKGGRFSLRLTLVP